MNDVDCLQNDRAYMPSTCQTILIYLRCFWLTWFLNWISLIWRETPRFLLWEFEHQFWSFPSSSAHNPPYYVSNLITWNLVCSIVAKCPGMAGTVPEFMPMSRLCPGRYKIVLMSWNNHEFHKPWVWSCHMISSVVPRKPCRCARTSFRHYFKHKAILVLFSSCVTFFVGFLATPTRAIVCTLIVSIMIKKL